MRLVANKTFIFLWLSLLLLLVPNLILHASVNKTQESRQSQLSLGNNQTTDSSSSGNPPQIGGISAPSQAQASGGGERFRISKLLAQTPKGAVHDFAKVLSIRDEKAIEEKLRSHRASTSNEIAVVVIPSLQGRQLEQFSIRLARSWGIGKKAENNGILLLVAMRERKIRIEVGYGLEAILTDAIAGSIIRNEMTPHFRRGYSNRGVDAGVTAIIDVLGGDHEYDPKSGNRKTDEPVWPWLFFAFIWIFVPMVGPAFGFRGSGGGSGAGFGGGGFGGGGASGGW